MVDVPAVIPVTTPVPEPTIATVCALLLHVPPVEASVKLTEEPTHTVAVPVMPAGTGSTVTVVVAVQPKGNEYVIVAVPSATEETTPLDDPTVAIVISLLLQVPPVAASLNVVVEPGQILSFPVIGANGFTVTTAEIVQPNGEV